MHGTGRVNANFSLFKVNCSYVHSEQGEPMAAVNKIYLLLLTLRTLITRKVKTFLKIIGCNQYYNS